MATAHAVKGGARQRAAFIQIALAVVMFLQLSWAVAGLIANPDFSTGDQATAKLVLGIDFNGWHALSGILLFAPGLVFALRKRWAELYALTAAFALAATGIWAIFDHRPMGLWEFRHNDSDAVLHLATSSVLVAIFLIGKRLERRARQA